MYTAYEKPVVPVATNLGLFWPGQSWNLRPGEAVIEFLDPIEPGLDKSAFMALLEERIETASLALLPHDFAIPANRLIEPEPTSDTVIKNGRERAAITNHVAGE